MTHLVIIKCTECGTTQQAQVEESTPFAVMIHHCTSCAYVIMESEWCKVSMRDLLLELGFDLVGEGWYKRYKNQFTLFINAEFYSADIMIDDADIILPLETVTQTWILNFDKLNAQ